MRRLILVATIVLVLAVVYRTMGSPTTGSGARAAPTLPGPAPTPGAWAPTFTRQSLDGATFELRDKGIYVLTFWDALNRDSSEAKPYFSQLAESFRDSGVGFAAVYVGASYEEPESEPGPAGAFLDRSDSLPALAHAHALGNKVAEPASPRGLVARSTRSCGRSAYRFDGPLIKWIACRTLWACITHRSGSIPNGNSGVA